MGSAHGTQIPIKPAQMTQAGPHVEGAAVYNLGQDRHTDTAERLAHSLQEKNSICYSDRRYRKASANSATSLEKVGPTANLIG